MKEYAEMRLHGLQATERQVFNYIACFTIPSFSWTKSLPSRSSLTFVIDAISASSFLLETNKFPWEAILVGNFEVSVLLSEQATIPQKVTVDFKMAVPWGFILYDIETLLISWHWIHTRSLGVIW